MTVNEFLKSDSQAEMGVKLFNDYYAGKECYINNRRNKKGMVLGIEKHLQYGTSALHWLKYSHRAEVPAEIILRAEKIVYTVRLELEESILAKEVPFEHFMKINSSDAVPKSAMSFRRPRKPDAALHH
jgi:hypothetical protein